MLSSEIEDQTRQEFARVGVTIEPPDDVRFRLLSHDYEPRGSRVRVVGASAALVVIAVVVLVVALIGPGAAPTSSPTAATNHLRLRLVADQVSLVNGSSLSAQAAITSISCSTSSACIAVGNATQRSAGFVATTADGGNTWAEQSLPSGLSSLTSLACMTASQCMAVGTRGDGAQMGPAIVATTDGGSTWSYTDIPSAPTSLTSIACTASRCWAAGAASGTAALLSGTPAGWSSLSVPQGVTSLTSVGCADNAGSTTCLAVGSAGSAPAAIQSLSGAPWAAVSVPAGASALASAQCTPTGQVVCSTLAHVENYWVEATTGFSDAHGAVGTVGWLELPHLPAGATVATGTLMGGVSSTICVGATPSCAPANAGEVNTVSNVIGSLAGSNSPDLNESLTFAYFGAQPSVLPGSIVTSNDVSAIWYMGVTDNGLTANLVLTPVERVS
jgi:photosystem II stability/assembly factor-like uncharacterized protein